MFTFIITSCCDKFRTELYFSEIFLKAERARNEELQEKIDTLNVLLAKATGKEEYKIKSEETTPQVSSGMTDEDFAGKAFIISKVFVKDRLVSPKSADFPFLDYKFSNVTNNTIIIESYVDSENSYGSEVRSSYKIKLKLIGSDWGDEDNWEVISLDLY
jgi:hypothetical protein